MQAVHGNLPGREIVAMQTVVISSGRGKCGFATSRGTAGRDWIPSAKTRPRVLPETRNNFRPVLCRCWKSLSQIEIAERTNARIPIPPSRPTAPRRRIPWAALPRRRNAIAPTNRAQRLRSAPVPRTLCDLDSWPDNCEKS